MESLRRWIALALLAVPSSAFGARVPHAVDLHIAEEGCPSRAAVAMALRTVFPDIRFAAENALRVEITDAGVDFRVVAGRTARDFVDGTRRCDERARKVAVLVALVLEPPTVDLQRANEVRLPLENVDPADARFPSLQLEAAGDLWGAPRSSGGLSVGGSLRLFLGGRNVGAVAGATGLSSATLDFGSVRARLLRIPFDLGLRVRLRKRNFVLAFDLAAALAVQITDGVDVAPSVEETRLELGVRLSARIEYWRWTRFAPFVALQADAVPRPFDLTLPGVGVIGTTPPFWLGAALGVAWRAR